MPLPSMGLAYADYDKDGWLDFVLGNWNQGYVLYRNTGGASHDRRWINVRLRGARRCQPRCDRRASGRFHR